MKNRAPILITILIIFMGILPFSVLAQISKTQVPVSNFTANPIEIDSVLLTFSNVDTLKFIDNTFGDYILISPTSFNLSVNLSNMYGKILDSQVYKKPHPKVKILMSFTISPIVENTDRLLINRLNTKDSLIYEGLIESEIFKYIPPINLLNVDLKKYIQLFAEKRYYLNYLHLDIVFIDNNYANVHQYSSFRIKQEILDRGL